MDFIVDNDNINCRIDKFCVEKTSFSRSYIKKLFENNCILLNDVVPKTLGINLKINDKITINQLNINFLNNDFKLVKVNAILDILYEDQYLIILNKPKNTLVYPINKDDIGLSNYLYNYLNTDPNIFNDPIRYGAVHRLDKDTNGIIIFAKNQDVLNQMQNMIQNNKIKKFYYAICLNHYTEINKWLLLDLEIGYDKNNSLKRIVDPNAKNAKRALTKVRFVKNLNNNLSLVECELITGRTHQIRVSLNYINHPIYNDPLYGKKKQINNYNQYLFAYKISFIHPYTNNKIEIKIDFDNNFKKLLED